jgi:hypothetical protein
MKAVHFAYAELGISYVRYCARKSCVTNEWNVFVQGFAIFAVIQRRTEHMYKIFTVCLIKSAERSGTEIPVVRFLCLRALFQIAVPTHP